MKRRMIRLMATLRGYNMVLSTHPRMPRRVGLWLSRYAPFGLNWIDMRPLTEAELKRIEELREIYGDDL